MEMNMGKFSEKLVELLELPKRKKMCWNIRKSRLFQRPATGRGSDGKGF